MLHSGPRDGPHSIADERVAATAATSWRSCSPPTTRSTATRARGWPLGRYKGDVYFSGGAYFFCTFGAAEFYYKLAAATRPMPA